MGWKDVARLGKDWAEAKKTELLTTDNHQRSQARQQQDHVERKAQEEASTSFFEAVLPEQWAQKVTDNRPENVAARRAEAQGRADAERRVRLAGQSTGQVTLVVTGGEQGQLDADLPVTVEERPGGEPYDDGPPPLDWLMVRVESADAVRLGTTTLTELSLAVPAYAGPGRYDLVDLMRRGEAGEIEWWEVLDIYLVRGPESDDSTWYPDLSEGPAWVEVRESSLAFDLPMQSALSAIRLAGEITWS